MHKTRWGRALLALMLIATVALAQEPVYDSAKPSKTSGLTAQTWYITGATGTDSRTDPSGLDKQQVLSGDTWVLVDVRGSIPGATAQIMLWTGGFDGVLDVAEVVTVTFTTAANPNSNGYQPLTRTSFTCAGDSFYAVGIPNVSAGTVDAKARTVGFGSRAAE